jgi:hypothetical protein
LSSLDRIGVLLASKDVVRRGSSLGPGNEKRPKSQGLRWEPHPATGTGAINCIHTLMYFFWSNCPKNHRTNLNFGAFAIAPKKWGNGVSRYINIIYLYIILYYIYMFYLNYIYIFIYYLYIILFLYMPIPSNNIFIIIYLCIDFILLVLWIFARC